MRADRSGWGPGCSSASAAGTAGAGGSEFCHLGPSRSTDFALLPPHPPSQEAAPGCIVLLKPSRGAG